MFTRGSKITKYAHHDMMSTRHETSSSGDDKLGFQSWCAKRYSGGALAVGNALFELNFYGTFAQAGHPPLAL